MIFSLNGILKMIHCPSRCDMKKKEEGTEGTEGGGGEREGEGETSKM